MRREKRVELYFVLIFTNAFDECQITSTSQVRLEDHYKVIKY